MNPNFNNATDRSQQIHDKMETDLIEAINLVNKGQRQKASVILKTILESNDIPQATSELVSSALKEIEVGQDELSKALEESVDMYEASNFEGALKILDSNEWPEDLLGDANLIRAAIKSNESRYTNASDFYLQNLEEDPECCDSLAGLARTQLAQGQLDQCYRTLKKSLKVNPDHVVTKLVWVEALINERKDEVALSIAEDLVQANPNLFLPRFRMCQILSRITEREAAFRESEKLLKYFPANKEALCLYAEMLNKLNKHDEALKVSEKVLDLDDSFVRATLQKAEALVGLEDAKRAKF